MSLAACFRMPTLRDAALQEARGRSHAREKIDAGRRGCQPTKKSSTSRLDKPKNRIQEMKHLIANYARVCALVQNIIATNIAIFKKIKTESA